MPSATPPATTYPGLRALLRADYEALGRHFPHAAAHLFPNYFVVAAYRVSHALCRKGRGLQWPAFLIMMVVHMLTGAEIRPTASFGAGLVVVHTTGIVIGQGVVTGERTSLYGRNSIGNVAKEPQPGVEPTPVRLGDDVVVLPNASILGELTVGSRVLVAAYGLVLHDVPDDVQVGGIPARILGPTKPSRT